MAEATAAEITDEGRLVGAAAYMSPEQAERRAVDHRSDIFSLGVLLFEMATGQRPFTGDTVVSLLSAVVKETPPLANDLRREVPRDLGRLIRRCLAKDVNRRCQSALDVRNELEEINQTLSGGKMAAAASAARASRPIRRTLIMAALSMLLLAAAIAAVWYVRSQEPAVRRVQLEVSLPARP